MRFRLELFVDDIDASIRFYEDALGFRLVRRDVDYASLELEGAILGLGSIAKLPADGEGPGFTRARLSGVRGAGVEIVLEVSDVDAALRAVEQAGHPVVEPLRDRPWGLRDFASWIPTATTCASRTPEAHGVLADAPGASPARLVYGRPCLSRL